MNYHTRPTRSGMALLAVFALLMVIVSLLANAPSAHGDEGKRIVTTTARTTDRAAPSVYGWHWAEPVDVYDDTPQPNNYKIAEAVREWGSISGGLTVRMTTNKADANIIVSQVADTCGNGCALLDNLTYNSDGSVSGLCPVELEQFYAEWPVAEEFGVHEIGHCLGLSHAPDGTRSVMTATVSQYDFFTRPQAYDKRDIKYIYGR